MAELKKQYKEFKKAFNGKNRAQFSNEDDIRFKELILFFSCHQVLQYIDVNGGGICILNLPWDEVDKLFYSTLKEKKKLNKREWQIAIVSSILGAVAGAIITALIEVIPLIISFFSNQ